MEKYLHFNIHEFIEEPSFVRWVEKESLNDDFNWNKWLDDNPQKKEEVNSAILLIKSISFKNEEIHKEVENSIWNKIEENTDENKVRRLDYRKIFISVAASIAIIVLAINFATYNKSIDVIADYAQIKNHLLPDESEVTLNSDSKLEYNKKKWHEQRTIELSGEAFFDVKKGKKFTVTTQNGFIEVLGTSFNVISRNEVLQVYCKSGKVKVNYKGKSKILTPNQSVKFENGSEQYKQKASISDQRISWIDGIYNYNDENLIEVIREIERQIGRKISLPIEFYELKYNGSFDIKKGSKILEEVLWPFKLTYTKQGDQIVINEK